MVIYTFDVTLGAIIGYAIGFAVARIMSNLEKRKEYKHRTVVKLKSEHIGGLKFKFIAESLSDKLVWLKSVELTSDSKSTAKLIFNPQIFRNGEVTQLRQDMPADFTGEVKISSVDAMVRVDNCWKECLVIVRGVKNDETDLEFFADEEG